MKKVLALSTTFGAFLTLASTAFAADVNACPTGASGFSVLCGFSFSGGFIQAIITILFIIAIIIALFYLIWGGIKWIMSGGDKQALEIARQHVIAAIIGLIIVFLAFFIVSFVLSVFHLGTGFNWSLPVLTS